MFVFSPSLLVVVVQLLSRVQVFVTPWTAACQASLSFSVSQSFLKLMSIELVMPSTISSSVAPFSSCPQYFPASGSFPMSRLFASGGQNIGASASVLAMSIQDLFPFGLTGLITLLSKGLSKVSSAPQFKSIDSSAFRLLYGPTLISVNDYRKNHSLTRQTFVGK